ncbi:hypothetical protein L6164_025935 [Bauhinia variegata]|uniref:Uncharacterized protein n=1 Tax=Bauhinia variegata TaxID=167791 RepID=A0ACB9M453_BAUVA|nr:hypothetical protein L6164_025935 [Bauhinia variegata]
MMDGVALSIKGCGVQPMYDAKNEHVIASSSTRSRNEKELEALVIPPIKKYMFSTVSLTTSTNWKNQGKDLIDILSLQLLDRISNSHLSLCSHCLTSNANGDFIV